MLRLLFDEQGNCTGDLFIKIDGRPSYVWTVDTGWLDIFFDEDHGLFPKENTVPTTNNDLIMSKKEDVGLLIKLWKQLLLSDEPVCYLACELSDQCGWAFRVTKGKKIIQHYSRVDKRHHRWCA